MKVDYRRISRRRRTPAGSSDLWLANDHLLLVTRPWFSERYARFRLSEIKSILIVERPSVRAIQIIGVAAVMALLALTAMRRSWLGVPLVPVLVWQLVDLFRGSYCRVELATAVSTVRLRPLSRMRAAVKFLATMTPLIEAAQGQWVPEPIPAAAEWGLSSSNPLPPPLPPPGSARGTTMETILFLGTLLAGAYEILSRHVAMPGVVWVLSWTLLAIPVVLGGMVAIGGRGGGKRVMAAFSAVICVVLGLSSVVRYFAVVSSAAKNGFDPYQAIARHTQPSVTGDFVGITVASIGLIGLMLTRRRVY
jgi:hypothetical protein